MSDTSYDAFLLFGFGGPEGPDEVVPFLEQVTAGRNIPQERLREVGRHYFDRGGVSPINEHCRDLLRRLEPAFDDAGLSLPLFWGNRNSAPFLADTLAEMRDAGVTRALAFVMSAYSSYSGCRQYRENIADAQTQVGPGVPEVDKLRVFFNHPGFVEPIADGVVGAIERIDVDDPADLHVFFTAHSIPTSMAAGSAYERQLQSAAELVADRVPSMPEWSLVWQSRSGPPSVPWLEPDICDAISTVRAEGVIVVPLGFVSDHMEVIQDLDTDAAAAAAAAGVSFERSTTAGTDPRFVQMIVELVRERVEGATPVALGDFGIFPEQCSAQCCPAPRRGGPAPDPSERSG